MKKMIFSAAALTLCFASCQKQNTAPAAANQPTYKKEKGFYQQEDKPMRKYWDDGKPNGEYGCKNEVENCAPEDVIINGIDQMSGLVTAIEESIYSGYVRNNRDVLAQTIPVQYLDNVINGSLRLSMKGEHGAAYRVILFKDNKEAVILAVPVVKP